MKKRISDYNYIDTTAGIIDLRNFTYLFEEFKKTHIENFLNFMEEYFKICVEIVKLVVDKKEDYVLKSTGDGMLLLFFGNHHQTNGYLFDLLVYKALKKHCNEFNLRFGTSISFGIGMESGKVQKVTSRDNTPSIETYLGSVINIAARIEAKTKEYERTEVIIGKSLYRNLLDVLLEDDVDEILNTHPEERRKSKDIITFHNKLNKLNQELMLFYIFEHKLKGVEYPMPLYRLSPTLADVNRSTYFNIVKKLSRTQEKYNAIMQYLLPFIDKEMEANNIHKNQL